MVEYAAPDHRLIIACALSLGVLALALLWAGQLRRRVAQRSAELAEEIGARRQSHIEFDATLLERRRMAADLHDGMEQTLNGLALQLQAAQRFLTSAPERTTHHLELSLSFLDSSREELRRSVWDLRSEGLAGRTLPQVLAERAPQWIEGRDVQLALLTEGPPQLVADLVASHLLMLAREAITNALKHGHATHLTLRTHFNAGHLTLRIEDDGAGFSPRTAPGPAKGHFGLQGMKERMARIGGTVQIESQPGQGATITATAPLT